MIDKVYFICAKPGNDRYWAQRAINFERGVPPDKLECFTGADAKQYDSFRSVAEDMVHDGFPEWEWFYENESGGQQSPHSLVIHWTHLQCIRQIRDNNETAIVIEDDCFLWKPFDKIEAAANSIEDLEVLYLWWTFFHDNMKDLYYKDRQMMKGIVPIEHPEIFTGYVPCGERAKLYTPRGAAVYLDRWAQHPYYSGETVSWHYNENETVDNHYFCFPMWAEDAPVGLLATGSYKT